MKLNIILLFLCLVVSSPLIGATHITLNGSETSFETRPRLVEVLSPIALQDDWYWPASALHSVNNSTLTLVRNEIILSLESKLTKTTENQSMHNAISNLISEINLWVLAERIPLQIDYDLARINPSHNPLFEEGSYTLNLKKRPNKLYAFGVISNSEMIEHKPSADVSEYVSAIPHLEYTNKDYLYIIQPDGKTKRVAHAYWNKDHQEIMPGSQLYIPFKNQLFSSENQQLNEKIVFLAANRILP